MRIKEELDQEIKSIEKDRQHDVYKMFYDASFNLFMTSAIMRDRQVQIYATSQSMVLLDKLIKKYAATSFESQEG